VNSDGRAGTMRQTRTLTSRVYSLTVPREVLRKETSELRIRNAYNILWTNVLHPSTTSHLPANSRSHNLSYLSTAILPSHVLVSLF